MKKIRVLCFGDSNTWGFDPRSATRFPENIRWTGILQERLGSGFQILEEGLNGRTTIFNYKERPGKHGLDYLRPCMDSHHAVDIVILNLGANDTKVEFGRAAEEIAAGLEQLIVVIHGKGLERPSPGVKLVVVAPTLISEAHIGDYAELVGGEAKTRRLPPLYRALAEKHGADFVDLSQSVRPSEADGCHIDPEGQRKIAEILDGKIREIVGRPSELTARD